jgi:membrane associated rhomboid family serine protease
MAKSIPARVHWSADALEVHVRPADAAAARIELDAFEAEEAEEQRAATADAVERERPATRYAAAGGSIVAVALMVLYGITGPAGAGSRWFAVGASDAARVIHGEWWRAITALTLHADATHVLGNVAIGAVVVAAAMYALGVGWGAALVLFAGAAGNLANAWVYGAGHVSVGFSTAVFGAVGILGGVAYLRDRRRLRKSRPAWTALGSSLALLAMLGASEHTDVLAHLFGGIAGVAVGLVAGRRSWTSAGQWAAGFGAIAAVVGAWLIAWR